MGDGFRDAELRGWTERASGYDKHFRAISGQLTTPLLLALETVSGRRILDVCCGPGHLAASLTEEGAEVFGIDFAPTMIDLAVRHYPELDFVVGDAEALAFPSEEFNHVVCAYGVMHLNEPDRAIAEAFRVLRPSGKYVFSQWAHDDELLALVAAAIADHGEPIAGLQNAPPPMRFSDPNECMRTLSTHGFINSRVERVDVRWVGEHPGDMLRLIKEAATRAALLIESQVPERRMAIEAAIMAWGCERLDDRGVAMRRPTLLAIGEKPVP